MQDNDTNDVKPQTRNKDGSLRKARATPEEMIARLEAQLDIARRRAAGEKVSAAGETYGAKRLRAAARKRRTALGRANDVLNGKVEAETGKVILKSIDQRIADSIARTDNLRDLKSDSEDRAANLPFDISALETAMEAAEQAVEAGTEPDYRLPEGLTLLPGEKSDAELESIAATDGTDDSFDHGDSDHGDSDGEAR